MGTAARWAGKLGGKVVTEIEEVSWLGLGVQMFGRLG